MQLELFLTLFYEAAKCLYAFRLSSYLSLLVPVNALAFFECLKKLIFVILVHYRMFQTENGLFRTDKSCRETHKKSDTLHSMGKNF